MPRGFPCTQPAPCPCKVSPPPSGYLSFSSGSPPLHHRKLEVFKKMYQKEGNLLIMLLVLLFPVEAASLCALLVGVPARLFSRIIACAACLSPCVASTFPSVLSVCPPPVEAKCTLCALGEQIRPAPCIVQPSGCFYCPLSFACYLTQPPLPSYPAMCAASATGARLN